MKKVFTLLLLILLPLMASSQTEIAGIYYYLYSYGETKTARVTSDPDKYSGDIVIPSTVTYNDVTYSVTSIGSSAFSGCTELTSVTIPESVTSIGSYAFQDCTAITTINIGSGVTNIGESAFKGCSGLVTMTIPNGVNNINSSTFSGCTSLLSVTIPEGVETIGDNAFYGCSSLIEVNMPNSVTCIGSYACYECKSLKSFVIPEGVETIEEYTFYGCEGMTFVSIPKSVKSIKVHAFLGCWGLKEVRISDVAAWCNMSFYETYLVGSNPLYYAGHLFLNGEKIKDLVIPETVTSLHVGAFYGGSGFTSITIPNSITYIPEYAFYKCSGTTSVYLPEDLTIIKGNAFQGCSGLETIMIPSKVEYIYQEAFANCGSLQSVKSLAATPPFLYENSFSNYDIPLSVPEGTRDAYLEKSPWNKFKEIISGSDTKYTLTYKVDGEVYKTYQLLEGAIITPEPAPTKEGYDFSGWSTIPATMPAEDVTITGTFTLLSDYDEITIKTTGKTTWCSKYDLDFTNVEGVKAYTAAGYDDDGKTIWLMRVSRVPAGTGIMVKGNAGTYQIPHATVNAYYTNMFKGNLGEPITINETDGDMTNYYLTGGQFVSVNKSATIGKNKAYLQLPTFVFAGTRSVGMSFDDEDGTTGISNAMQFKQDDVFYNLQGQRVDNPGKGLYIRNGKKVIR